MYEDIQSRAESDVEKYVGNPLNSYLLIKKLTSDWKEVKNLMATNLGETMFTNMTDSFQRPLKWPSEEDLSGAAIALTRLQETYKLDPSDLANGKLNGVKYGPSLSSHDCFELGRQHYNNADYDHTIQWMEEAVNRLDDEIIGEVSNKNSKNSKKNQTTSICFQCLLFGFWTNTISVKSLTNDI
jgi:prolyl 4-hydroxylase